MLHDQSILKDPSYLKKLNLNFTLHEATMNKQTLLGKQNQDPNLRRIHM